MVDTDQPGLLERSGARSELAAATDVLDRGGSRLVLVHGEAGIGKTSLIRTFCAGLSPDRRVLLGQCDDLAAPPPLGAIHELADGLAARGDRVDLGDHPGRALAEALRTEPTICVIDDVHWADQATLDVLTYLARRVSELPLLLVLTFRDDELPADHPLHRTLAAAPPSHCRRIGLAPLSLAAVRRLAGWVAGRDDAWVAGRDDGWVAGRDDAPGVDADAVHRVTGGNPFFVTEALTSGTSRVPASVRESVLGRFARLPADARATAELVSVVPGRAEHWLVEACLGATADVAAGERYGLLTVGREGVSFRHELARRAIEESLSGQQRAAHNHAVLRALVAADAPDARLAHHAWRAGDADAVIRHGLAAAASAAASHSHREAADLLRQVLAHATMLAPRVLADVLDDYSTESYRAGRQEQAVQACERALAIRRELGDRRRIGHTLGWLARVRWVYGDRAGAEAAADEAVVVLTTGVGDGSPRRELAMALSIQSQLAMLAQRDDEAIRQGECAVAIAETLGDTETLTHAQVNIATAVAQRDLDDGLKQLKRTAGYAAGLGHDDTACRALTNAAWRCLTNHRMPEATELVEQAMVLAKDRELSIYIDYLQVTRALLALARGELALAATLLERASNANRAPLLVVRAAIAVRRDVAEDPVALLDEGWRVAQATDELQRLRPMASVRAEWEWLHGDLAAVDDATRDTYQLSLQRGTPWEYGELAEWRWRAGVLDQVPDGLAEPYALAIAGRARDAAAAWARLGEPYAQALALLCSDDACDVTAAIELLDRIGAAGVLPFARARLRELGVSSVPRGRARSTRVNPAGLTDRQLEVLRLLVRGMSNADIARHLVLSPKTVEHHLGAVFGKLGVTSRADAVAAARRLEVDSDWPNLGAGETSLGVSSRYR